MTTADAFAAPPMREPPGQWSEAQIDAVRQKLARTDARLALADEIARAAVWEAKGFPHLFATASWQARNPVEWAYVAAYARAWLAARKDART